MIDRPKINDMISNCGEKVICFLHYRYAHSENVVFTATELSEVIPHFNERMISISLEDLLDSEYVSKEHFTKLDVFDASTTGSGYAITRLGIHTVESWPDNEYEKIADGIDFLIEDNDASNIAVPASNRIVTLADNQREEATKTLEAIIKEFQEDHHFGNEWVAEKGALLKALENGKEYLEAKTLDVRIGTMMIIEPLQAIVDKYKEAAINGTFSAMVQKALEYFINLLAG